ncbi:MAG: PEP-CTERM sorting domain-containing protein [Burkholderiales bacterium]|nr:PEP-CTERM sorting domain-containing protein [Burkholderiales bacterium]
MERPSNVVRLILLGFETAALICLSGELLAQSQTSVQAQIVLDRFSSRSVQSHQPDLFGFHPEDAVATNLRATITDYDGNDLGRTIGAHASAFVDLNTGRFGGAIETELVHLPDVPAMYRSSGSASVSFSEEIDFHMPENDAGQLNFALVSVEVSRAISPGFDDLLWGGAGYSNRLALWSFTSDDWIFGSNLTDYAYAVLAKCENGFVAPGGYCDSGSDLYQNDWQHSLFIDASETGKDRFVIYVPLYGNQPTLRIENLLAFGASSGAGIWMGNSAAIAIHVPVGVSWVSSSGSFGSITAVPEPSTWLLLGLGFLGLSARVHASRHRGCRHDL